MHFNPRSLALAAASALALMLTPGATVSANGSVEIRLVAVVPLICQVGNVSHLTQTSNGAVGQVTHNCNAPNEVLIGLGGDDTVTSPVRVTYGNMTANVLPGSYAALPFPASFNQTRTLSVSQGNMTDAQFAAILNSLSVQIMAL